MGLSLRSAFGAGAPAYRDLGGCCEEPSGHDGVLTKGLVAVNYTARCHREGRWWVVEVPELGHTTQARRLDKVEEMVRSLVQMFTDLDPSSATVTVDVVFVDDQTRVEVELARDSRARAVAAQQEATERLTQAARRLSSQGYSVRDIGALLGLSYQRAQQLTQ